MLHRSVHHKSIYFCSSSLSLHLPSTIHFQRVLISMEGALKSLSSVLLLLCLISGGVMATSESEGMTWCVAKPSTAEIALVDNIGYACSMVDCTILQEGNPCFYPNNNISHASVAMNLYYQTRGRNNWNCDFTSTGLIVATDPSFGSCVYLAANY